MSTGIVVRNPPRVDGRGQAALARLPVATIHEARGRAGLLDARLRPIYPDVHVAGVAVTVSVPPGDNWMIHVAMELCRPGDLLVVAPTSPCDAGYFGELLATAAQARGVVGLVIDAGCRDVRRLRELRFPVWSRHISATGTVKETLGTVNLPIVCAGQLLEPGDVVVADDDGVVVVPRRDAARVAAEGQAREAREEAVRQRYQAGELSLDVGSMRERLRRKGLTYLDAAGPEEVR